MNNNLVFALAYERILEKMGSDPIKRNIVINAFNDLLGKLDQPTGNRAIVPVITTNISPPLSMPPLSSFMNPQLPKPAEKIVKMGDTSNIVEMMTEDGSRIVFCGLAKPPNKNNANKASSAASRRCESEDCTDDDSDYGSLKHKHKKVKTKATVKRDKKAKAATVVSIDECGSS